MSSRSGAATARPSQAPGAPAASTGKFVQAGALRLHYLDYGGEGKRPMLCVHGGAAHAHWFDFVASGFTADHHVLALDLRGHGDSARADPPAYAYRDYADDVANFAGALDLRDFVLVGHSMGGMVSLVYAATRPSRMARLVIVDSSMHLSAEGVARLRESGARPPRTYPTREALVERFRLEPPGPKIAAPAIIRHIATMSARELPEGTWTHKFDRSLYAAFERIDGMPYWDSIRVPTLLVKGEFSARLDSRTLARIRSCAPQVEFAVVAQSAHHVMLDNPAGFVQAVTPFLAKP